MPPGQSFAKGNLERMSGKTLPREREARVEKARAAAIKKHKLVVDTVFQQFLERRLREGRYTTNFLIGEMFILEDLAFELRMSHPALVAHIKNRLKPIMREEREAIIRREREGKRWARRFLPDK